MATRKIIEIDEDKCTGCGQCIIACAESALEIVDGKAKLVKDIYCDGLGACLGECPEDALHVIEREAADFDETAVEQRIEELGDEAPDTAKAHLAEVKSAKADLPCGCPGTAVQTLKPASPKAGEASPATQQSELGQWPIKLQLLGPHAAFLQGADLVLMADCVGVSHPNVHRHILRGNVIALGCPKLDDLQAHIDRLAEILKGARPKSLTVAHMEVPCCHGFVQAAKEAIKQSGVSVPLKRIQIGLRGDVQIEEEISAG